MMSSTFFKNQLGNYVQNMADDISLLQRGADVTDYDRFIPGVESSTTIKAAIFPQSAERRRFLPEGEINENDLLMYVAVKEMERKGVTIAINDRILWQGAYFEIKTNLGVDFWSGISRYTIAKEHSPDPNI